MYQTESTKEWQNLSSNIQKFVKMYKVLVNSYIDEFCVVAIL